MIQPGVVPANAPWPGAPANAVAAWHGRVPLRYPGWGQPDAWIAVAGGLLAAIAVGSLLLLHPASPQWQSTVVLLSLVAQWVPMAGWPLVTTRWKGNGIVLDLGLAFRRSDLLWGVGGGIAVVAAASVVGLLTQKVVGDFSSNAGDLLADVRDQPVQLVLLALAVGIGAPIVEEICFRGLFWSSLAKRGMSPWWSTILTAVVFSVAHIEGVRIPLLLVTGVILGYLRQRTGRLGASMLAHMVNNLVGVLGLFVT